MEATYEIDVEKWKSLCESTLSSLEAIWNEMGLSDEERQRQVKSMVDQVEKVFSSKLEDERALVQEYRRLVVSLQDEINNLRKNVLESVPPDSADLEIPEKELESLTTTLTWLRAEKEKLDQVRAERLSAISNMQQKLMEMWTELGEEPVKEYSEIGDKITVERIEAYEAQLILVKQQWENRVIALRSACEDICELFHELELTPTSPLDVAISKNSRKNNAVVPADTLVDLGLTMDTVQEVSQRARELTDEKISRTERIKQLGSQIQPLWELLEVTEDYRTQFFMDNRGLGETIINQCEIELEKLLEQKKDKMVELIQAARVKVHELVQALGGNESDVLETYRELLTREVYNDETLLEHNDLISLLQEQNDMIQPVFKSIEKYKNLVEDRKDYEMKIQDSSRLLSRKRGALREEELQRKRVTIQLPKLIKSLRGLIEGYEKEYGDLIYQGERYLDRLETIEREHAEQVAEQKAAKLKARNQTGPGGTPKHKTPRKPRPHSATKENVSAQ